MSAGLAGNVTTENDMSKTMIDKMVDRFLCWKLPKDFAPDAGISFKPTKPDSYDGPAHCRVHLDP